MAKTSKEQAYTDYHDRLANSRVTSPVDFLLDVVSGKRKKPKSHEMEAAKALLPYTLPRLAQVEATNVNVDVSHEDWLALMDDEQGQDAD